MIVSLTGTITSASGQQVVIDVAGVGYAVHVTPAHALSLRIGDATTLHTSFVVREDAHTLYGFETPADRDTFETLTGVSGVGPKSALGVLAAMSADDIANAVTNEDDAAFRKVSGIGPKTAKHMVVALAGKFTSSSPHSPARVHTDVTSQVVEALVSLGWKESVAQEAVDATVAAGATAGSAPKAHTVSSLLRTTLTALAGGSRS